MKDLNKDTLEMYRPDHSAAHCINHALNALYRDQSKCIEDEVVRGLTFEELIGALLLARDATENEADRELREMQEA